jgi:hypothetical protein
MRLSGRHFLGGRLRHRKARMACLLRGNRTGPGNPGEDARIAGEVDREMQNASQNNKMEKLSEDQPTDLKQETIAETADDLVMHIARVAELAAQCEREGNPATAIALRRVAEALWGKAFKRRPQAKPGK